MYKKISLLTPGFLFPYNETNYRTPVSITVKNKTQYDNVIRVAKRMGLKYKVFEPTDNELDVKNNIPNVKGGSVSSTEREIAEPVKKMITANMEPQTTPDVPKAKNKETKVQTPKVEEPKVEEPKVDSKVLESAKQKMDTAKTALDKIVAEISKLEKDLEKEEDENKKKSMESSLKKMVTDSKKNQITYNNAKKDFDLLNK